MARRNRRQRRRRRERRGRFPAPLCLRQPDQRFAVQRVAGAGRIGDGVGQAMVDALQSRRVEVVEPRELHRRWLRAEDREPVVPGVSGDVDQDVDTVVADPLRDRLVLRAAHHAGGQRAQPGEGFRRLRIVEIREQVEVLRDRAPRARARGTPAARCGSRARRSRCAGAVPDRAGSTAARTSAATSTRSARRRPDAARRSPRACAGRRAW